MTGRLLIGVLVAVLAVSACGRKEPGKLFNLRSPGNGPDEFAIVPTKPLELPKDLAVLPAPTPGTLNRVDQRPTHDAVAALGGRSELLDSTGINRGEQALVTAATRYGVANNIRDVLAKSDAEFRTDHGPRLLERLFKTSVYFRVYQDQSLDVYRELNKLRRAGVRTPTAPPEQ